MSLFFRGKEIKYIVSDLDGTLLFGEGHVLEDEIYDAIQQCIQNDVEFIVASGRTYENERIVLKPVADKIHYIASSGSMGVCDGEMIFNHILDKESVNNIIDIAHTIEGCATFISSREGFYTDTNNAYFINHMHNNVKVDVKVIPSISEIKEPIEKVSIFYYEGADKVQKQFEEKLNNLEVLMSGPQWLDFLIPNVNKGSALVELLKHLNIDIQDGIAFGDQQNDIEMIRVAGIGCCMKTGVPRAKEVADMIIDTPKTILKEMLGK